MMDSLGDAVLVIDAENYTILDANNQATITYNLPTQDIIGKTCYQITHQKKQPCQPNSCPIHTALKTMKPCTVEHNHIDADGNKHITEITLIPLLTEEKNTVVHISRDITERKLLLERIEEDERRYHALFEQAPLGILMIDPESLEAVEFNELAHIQLGYTRQEFSQLTVRDYKANTTPQKMQQDINRILTQGKYEFEDKHVTKTGEIRDVIITSQTIELSGKTYLQSIYRDITDAKKVERALMESEAMYRVLVENAREGVWALDSSNRTVYVNPKLAKMLRYSESELLGKPLNDFLDQTEVNATKDGWEMYRKGNQSEFEFVFRRKDGIRINALVSFSTIEDDRGGFSGTLALVTDITLRKAMEEKLEAYSRTLEATVRKRTDELLEAQARLVKAERLAAIGEVAAMVGHDLRNPLTGINGALFYLRKKLPPNLGPEIAEMFDVIEKDIKYANCIVTDLMEYSREIKLELRDVTPKQLIHDSLNYVNIPADIKVVDLSEDTLVMRLDAQRMQRVFTNFLKNAVEAMPKGGELSITSQTRGETVAFRVADNGAGMTKEVVDKIWIPFFTTKAKGMGLGLPICKRIIDAHDGKVSVESVLGKGTIFTIKLPIQAKFKH